MLARDSTCSPANSAMTDTPLMNSDSVSPRSTLMRASGGDALARRAAVVMLGCAKKYTISAKETTPTRRIARRNRHSSASKTAKIDATTVVSLK